MVRANYLLFLCQTSQKPRLIPKIPGQIFTQSEHQSTKFTHSVIDQGLLIAPTSRTNYGIGYWPR